MGSFAGLGPGLGPTRGSLREDGGGRCCSKRVF